MKKKDILEEMRFQVQIYARINILEKELRNRLNGIVGACGELLEKSRKEIDTDAIERSVADRIYDQLTNIEANLEERIDSVILDIGKISKLDATAYNETLRLENESLKAELFKQKERAETLHTQLNQEIRNSNDALANLRQELVGAERSKANKRVNELFEGAVRYLLCLVPEGPCAMSNWPAFLEIAGKMDVDWFTLRRTEEKLNKIEAEREDAPLDTTGALAVGDGLFIQQPELRPDEVSDNLDDDVPPF